MPAHEGFQDQGFGFLFQALQFGRDFLHHAFVVFLLGQLHHGVHVVAAGHQGIVMLDTAFQIGDAAVHVGGAFQVIPEAVGVHFLMQLLQLPFHVVHVQPFAHFLELAAQGVHPLGILI